MYVMVVFALALLSPLPFVSPFDTIVQDANAQSSTQNIPQPFSLVDDIVLSPAGTLNTAISFDDPIHVSTFEIDDSTYAGIGNEQGLLIIDITDIESPEYVSRVNGTGANLNNIPFTTFVVIDGFTYALSIISDFAVHDGDFEYYGRVMITDVSIPDYPIVLKTITNGTDGYTKMRHPTSIATATIDSSTYALVTSASSDASASLASLGGYSQTISHDDGVQIIDITNPSNPTAVSSITDGVDGFTELKGAASITTMTLNSSTYALVASSDDNGVQIIDITNPSNPTAVSSITDGNNAYTELNGAIYITTTAINSSTYALVAGQRDHGIQIIDVTDPYVPFAVSSPSHGTTYSKLVDASSIAITTTDSSTYAFVTSPYNHVFEASGVQIIDITNPYAPTPVSTIVDNAGGYTELDGANFITTTTIDSSTYALVTARDDDGVQIISLESPMSFNTNNPNPAYAKAGDTLAFGFTANDIIASHTTQFLIPDQTPYVSITEASYDAVLNVSFDPVEDYAQFTINLTNNQSADLVVTEDDFPTSIFVDTIGPRIDLVGSSHDTVLVGSSYFVDGAIVTDGDPRYSQNYTVTINGILDTTQVGSTVTYTYTASSDTAGNPGASVTRTVTVVDYDLLYVPNLAVISNNAVNSSYAKAGDEITITITTNSSTITSVMGTLHGSEEFVTTISDYNIFLTKTITQNDVNGDLEFEFLVRDSNNGYALVTHDNLSTIPIIIDTISPTITLNGVNNTIVHLGDSYTDPGAIASDSAYVNDIIVHGIGSVDTFQIGTYTITYTAPADMAGNPGSTISRTVSVLDNMQNTTNSTNMQNTTNSTNMQNTTNSTNMQNTTNSTNMQNTTNSTNMQNTTNSTNMQNTTNSTNMQNTTNSTNMQNACMYPESSYNIITGDNSSTILNGTAGNDLIYGTGGNDIINGLGGNDCIFGNGGEDVIDGGYGHDMIYGGDANDDIHGGFGHDIIKGGDGNDTIDGQYGHDDISGGHGHDLLYGGNGKDIINGNAGHDVLFGDGSDDTINGNDGDDTIIGGSGHDIIAGGDGDDTLYGGNGKDIINGDAGDDELFGDGNDDTLSGDNGNDVIIGGYGDDVISGGSDDDTIDGESGHDYIDGENGHDIIYGGGGNDTINGDAGNDTITGGFGHDILSGGDGDDTIDGEYGNDVIAGENGDDTLYGGGGDDTINGGNDNDVISGGSGHDIIAGGDGDDTIDGGYGNNVISTGHGDDSLYIGDENSTMIGGFGNNTIIN